MENVHELEQLRRQAEREQEKFATRIKAIQETCRHTWGEVKYTPDIQEAYTIPGDAPGTMGVDWRGPCYVPRKEIPKWTRVCKHCDKMEVTTKIRQEVTRIPTF